jgi:hypothetical protein
MGCSSSKNKYGVTIQTVEVANGTIEIDSRVSTQFTKEEGGNDNWYSGSVTDCYSKGFVGITYDDGDRSIVEARYVTRYIQPPSIIPIAYPVYN